ncbi:MAG: PIG-L family deacetylase [Steroidobacteraceae bacterium]
MNALTRVWLKRLAARARPYLRSTGMLQMSGVYGRTATAWTPGNERVLVLAPHMDDESIGCGGTVALHAQRGAQITVVFMTDGRRGTADVTQLTGAARERREREVVALRKQEAERAAQDLGIGDTVYLDAPDGELSATAEIAARLREVIEQRKPELVYLPHFLEEHADHRATTAVLMAAALDGPWRFVCMGYEVWTPLFPNCLVRIDQTVGIKKRALSRYVSQIEQADYTQASIGLNAYRAIGLHESHGSYAEAFCAVNFADYRKQYVEFGTQAQWNTMAHTRAEWTPAMAREGR